MQKTHLTRAPFQCLHCPLRVGGLARPSILHILVIVRAPHFRKEVIAPVVVVVQVNFDIWTPCVLWYLGSICNTSRIIPSIFLADTPKAIKKIIK